MDSYTILAKYYDKLMGDFNYKGYVAFIKDKLFGEGVDLCCGTGRITIELAKDHPMIGMDSSSDMLNKAIESSRTFKGNKLVWVEEDVVDFKPPHKVDFAVCVCDGFNYVNNNDIKKVFDNVSSYVKEGGKFIFDISSEYKLKNILGNNVFCEDTDDATYVWSNYYDEDDESVEMQIGFFENIEDDIYKRIDEEHIQYVHKKDFILEILKDKWNVEIYDGTTFSSVNDKSQRLLFIATRK